MRKLSTLFFVFVATVIGGVALAAPRDTLPFIDDDYAQALAEARAKRVPIFVEVWAPW